MIILGQEQDAYEGLFDAAQTFRGKLTPLNIWSDILSEEDIAAMAACKVQLVGDVVNSESENWQKVNATSETVEESTLCNKDAWADKLMLIADTVSFDYVMPVCSIAGGKLPTPRTAEEVEELTLEMNQIIASASVSNTCGDFYNNFVFLVGQASNTLWSKKRSI